MAPSSNQPDVNNLLDQIWQLKAQNSCLKKGLEDKIQEKRGHYFWIDQQIKERDDKSLVELLVGLWLSIQVF